MAPTIRLLKFSDSTLKTFELEKTPPYLAISHAWSDHIYPEELPIDTPYGGKIYPKHTLLSQALTT